jgi:hypothetical protein
MKSSVALLALVAGVLAIPQQSASITSPPVASASLDPKTASLVSCINLCDPADVTCRAQCAGVARPNSSQVVETNECAAKCDQGSGSSADAVAFAKCQQDCFASLFPSTQTVAPFAPGSPSSAGATPSGSSGSTPSAGSSPSGTGSQPTDASGSPTGSAASPSGSNAANVNSVQFLGAGLAGFMAIFAL